MTRLLAAAGLLAALNAPAFAQTTGAGPTLAFPGLAGPAVPGVCLLSREDLITRSHAGQAATAHLRTLASESEGNVAAEKARLEARGKALEAKRATLTPEQLKTEVLTLQKRAQALQTEVGERSRSFDQTRLKTLEGVLEAARPAVAAAFAAHKCGLLIGRESVLGGDLSGDLTPEVLKAMDAPASAPAPAPAAAPPAAPRP